MKSSLAKSPFTISAWKREQMRHEPWVFYSILSLDWNGYLRCWPSLGLWWPTLRVEVVEIELFVLWLLWLVLLRLVLLWLVLLSSLLSSSSSSLLSIKLWWWLWWLLLFWSHSNIESRHPSLQCEQRGHEFLVGRLDGCKPQHVKEAAGGDPNWRVGHCDPAVRTLRKARLQSGKDAEHFVADGLVIVSCEEQSSLLHDLTMRLEGGMEKAALQEHLVASLQGDRLILIPLKSKQAARLRPSNSQARLVQESLDKMQAIPGVDCDVHEFAIVSVEREGPPSPAVFLQDGKTKHPVKTKKWRWLMVGVFLY